MASFSYSVDKVPTRSRINLGDEKIPRWLALAQYNSMKRNRNLMQRRLSMKKRVSPQPCSPDAENDRKLQASALNPMTTDVTFARRYDSLINAIQIFIIQTTEIFVSFLTTPLNCLAISCACHFKCHRLFPRSTERLMILFSIFVRTNSTTTR